MKRVFFAFILLIALAAGLLLYAWDHLNSYIIPKIITPRVITEIDKTLQGKAKLAIGRIVFEPWRGFVLHDIAFTVNNKSQLFSAKEIDVDLAWLALLSRRVEISRLKINSAEVSVVRDRRGTWSFKPLLELQLMGQKSKAGYSFVLNEADFNDASLEFSDHYKQQPAFKKHLYSLSIIIKNPRPQVYQLSLFGKSTASQKESFAVQVFYDYKLDSLWGGIEGETFLFSQYWQHYLKNLFKPWEAKINYLKLNTNFSYSKEAVVIDGDFDIKKGVFAYGQLELKSDARGKIHYVNNQPWGEIQLSNFSFAPKKGQLLDHGQASIVMTDKTVIIKSLSCQNMEIPISLAGEYLISPQRKLMLTGKTGNFDNKLDIEWLDDDQATAKLGLSSGTSHLDLSTRLVSIKNLIFDANVSGDMNFTRLPDDFDLDTDEKTGRIKINLKGEDDNLRGRITVDGNVKGQINHPKTLAGNIKLKFIDIQVASLEPRSFDLDLTADNGVFEAQIPMTEFYGGTIYGNCLLDTQSWGIELRIEKGNLAALAKTDDFFKDLKGIFNGNIACAADWQDFGTIIGGGYVELKDADVKNSPLSKIIEEGIAQVNKGFKMPNFKEIKGDFVIGNKQVKMEHTSCQAEDLNLALEGKVGFNGETNITAGIKFLSPSLLRTVRLILFPVTIGFDILANAIRVNINGTWPDLKQKTIVQPMHWLDESFGDKTRPNPDRFKLKDLWE
jgi:hypothetical protein